MKLFISQPMNGKSVEEIQRVREVAIAEVREMFDEDIDVIDSFIKDDPPDNVNIPAWYFARSILLMSNADVVYFAKGWRETRGCVLENEVANVYGLCCVQTG